jgi:hypothetical protein
MSLSADADINNLFAEADTAAAAATAAPAATPSDLASTNAPASSSASVGVSGMMSPRDFFVADESGPLSDLSDPEEPNNLNKKQLGMSAVMLGKRATVPEATPAPPAKCRVGRPTKKAAAAA